MIALEGRVAPVIGLGRARHCTDHFIQRRAALVGLEDDFGGYCLHSGFVTVADRQGVALPAVMAMSDHRSVASVADYYQGGSAKDDPASRLNSSLYRFLCCMTLLLPDRGA